MDNSLPSTKNVQIIHANINGLYKRSTELINYINEYKSIFVTLNVTRLREQTRIRIPNYNIENFRHIINSYPISIFMRKLMKN